MRNNSKNKFRSPLSSFTAVQTLINKVVTLPFRGIPVAITSGVAGNGMFTNSGTGITNGNTYPIDPYTLTGRVNTIASQFAEWRLLDIEVIFRPSQSGSGVEASVTDAVSPGYKERVGAIGVGRDPTIANTNFANCVQFGGKLFRTSSPVTLYWRAPRSEPWRYTSTWAGLASATGPDERQVMPLILYGCWESNSTTGLSYGYLEIVTRMQFRGPTVQTLIGASSLSTSNINVKNEQKEEVPRPEQTLIVQEPATPSAEGFIRFFESLPAADAAELLKKLKSSATKERSWFSG